MSWIVSKGCEFETFDNFSTSRSDCARLRGQIILKRGLFQLQFLMDKRRPEGLTLLPRFSDLSVSCNLLSKSKNPEICQIPGVDFLIVRVRVI